MEYARVGPLRYIAALVAGLVTPFLTYTAIRFLNYVWPTTKAIFWKSLHGLFVDLPRLLWMPFHFILFYLGYAILYVVVGAGIVAVLTHVFLKGLLWYDDHYGLVNSWLAEALIDSVKTFVGKAVAEPVGQWLGSLYVTFMTLADPTILTDVANSAWVYFRNHTML